MLEIDKIQAGYGYLQILWDISLNVRSGEIVAILGPNGAGKTTTLKCIMSMIEVRKGKVAFLGEDITRQPVHELIKRGIAFVSEERNLFPAMTVYENLLLGAYTVNNRQAIEKSLSYVFELFPRLAERKNQYAGTMSGGERQMLAIARGLMSNPKILILDEPSMGLAPQNVVTVFETIQKLRNENMTVLIVEQNVNTTLAIADRAYVMEHGRIVMEGTAGELSGNEHIKKMYMGIA